MGNGSGNGDPWPAIARAEGRCNGNGALFSHATAMAQGNGNGAIAANVSPEGKYYGESNDGGKEFEVMIEHLRRSFPVIMSKSGRKHNGVKKCLFN